MTNITQDTQRPVRHYETFPQGSDVVLFVVLLPKCMINVHKSRLQSNLLIVFKLKQAPSTVYWFSIELIRTSSNPGIQFKSFT